VLSDKNYDWDGPRPDDDSDEHEQPMGFDEDDDWEFNDTCECDGCLENHENLELPLEWCYCDACTNLHSDVEAPVDGCTCQHCVDLDEHSPPLSQNSRWPWKFNADCYCERCLNTGPDDEYDDGEVIFHYPWADAPKAEQETKPRNSESLFQAFQQANARTMRKGASWSAEEDAYLMAAYFEDSTIADIALRLMRTDYAIVRRLIRRLLEDKGLDVKSSEDVDYILEDTPWAESDRLACKALFRSGFSPLGIASALKRRPLSVAAELIKDPALFGSQ
jgi:hypothetical protein